MQDTMLPALPQGTVATAIAGGHVPVLDSDNFTDVLNGWREVNGVELDLNDPADKMLLDSGYNPIGLDRMSPYQRTQFVNSLAHPNVGKKLDDPNHNVMVEANEFTYGVPDFKYWEKIESNRAAYKADPSSKNLAKLQISLLEYKDREKQVRANGELYADAADPLEKAALSYADKMNYGVAGVLGDAVLSGSEGVYRVAEDIVNYWGGDKEDAARVQKSRAIDRYLRDVQRVRAMGRFAPVGGFVEDVANTASEMIPVIGATLASPMLGAKTASARLLAGMPVVFAQSASRSAEEARQAGWSTSGQLAYGTAHGAKEVATEVLGGKLLGRFGIDTAETAAAKLYDRMGLSTALSPKDLGTYFGLRVGATSLGEGLEEGALAEPGGAIIDLISGMDPTDFTSPVETAKFLSNFSKEAGYAFALGAVVGGGMGAVTTGIELASAVERAETIAQAADQLAKQILEGVQVGEARSVAEGDSRFTHEQVRGYMERTSDGNYFDSEEEAKQWVESQGPEMQARMAAAAGLGYSAMEFANVTRNTNPQTEQEYDDMLKAMKIVDKVDVSEARPEKQKPRQEDLVGLYNNYKPAQETSQAALDYTQGFGTINPQDAQFVYDNQLTEGEWNQLKNQLNTNIAADPAIEENDTPEPKGEVAVPEATSPLDEQAKDANQAADAPEQAQPQAIQFPFESTDQEDFRQKAVAWQAEQLKGAQIPLDVVPWEDGAAIVTILGRDVIRIRVGDAVIPFYVSTGGGGKKNVATKKWYPFFGVSDTLWFNKGSERNINEFYGSKTLRNIAEELDRIFPADQVNIPSGGLATREEEDRNIDAVNAGLGVTPIDEGGEALKKNIMDVFSRAGLIKSQSPVPPPQSPASQPTDQAPQERPAEAPPEVPADTGTFKEDFTKKQELDDLVKEMNAARKAGDTIAVRKLVQDINALQQELNQETPPAEQEVKPKKDIGRRVQRIGEGTTRITINGQSATVERLAAGGVVYREGTTMSVTVPDPEGPGTLTFMFETDQGVKDVHKATYKALDGDISQLQALVEQYEAARDALEQTNAENAPPVPEVVEQPVPEVVEQPVPEAIEQTVPEAVAEPVAEVQPVEATVQAPAEAPVAEPAPKPARRGPVTPRAEPTAEQENELYDQSKGLAELYSKKGRRISKNAIGRNFNVGRARAEKAFNRLVEEGVVDEKGNFIPQDESLAPAPEVAERAKEVRDKWTPEQEAEARARVPEPTAPEPTDVEEKFARLERRAGTKQMIGGAPLSEQIRKSREAIAEAKAKVGEDSPQFKALAVDLAEKMGVSLTPPITEGVTNAPEVTKAQEKKSKSLLRNFMKKKAEPSPPPAKDLPPTMGREPGQFPSLGTDKIEAAEPVPEDMEASFVTALLEAAFPRAAEGTFSVKRADDKIIVEVAGRQVEVKLVTEAQPISRAQAIDMLKKYGKEPTEQQIQAVMTGLYRLGWYDARNASGRIAGGTIPVINVMYRQAQVKSTGSPMSRKSALRKLKKAGLPQTEKAVNRLMRGGSISLMPHTLRHEMFHFLYDIGVIDQATIDKIADHLPKDMALTEAISHAVEQIDDTWMGRLADWFFDILDAMGLSFMVGDKALSKSELRKLATGNSLSTKMAEVTQAREEAYTKAINAGVLGSIETKPLDMKLKIDDALNRLKSPKDVVTLNYLTKQGVSPSELFWLGVEDLLNERGGSVTKGELTTFLSRANLGLSEVWDLPDVGEESNVHVSDVQIQYFADPEMASVFRGKYQVYTNRYDLSIPGLSYADVFPSHLPDSNRKYILSELVMASSPEAARSAYKKEMQRITDTMDRVDWHMGLNAVEVDRDGRRRALRELIGNGIYLAPYQSKQRYPSPAGWGSLEPEGPSLVFGASKIKFWGGVGSHLKQLYKQRPAAEEWSPWSPTNAAYEYLDAMLQDDGFVAELGRKIDEQVAAYRPYVRQANWSYYSLARRAAKQPDPKMGGVSTYRNFLVTWDGIPPKGPRTEFTSLSMRGHWKRLDEDVAEHYGASTADIQKLMNVVVNARLSDATVAGVGRVLIVEELQSDQYQALRELDSAIAMAEDLGKITTDTTSDFSLKYYLSGQLNSAVRKLGGESMLAQLQADPHNADAILKAGKGSLEADLALAKAAAKEFESQRGPLDKKYKEFMLKRLVIEGAAEGYDAIAWPEGKWHEEMYYGNHDYADWSIRAVRETVDGKAVYSGSAASDPAVDVPRYFNEFTEYGLRAIYGDEVAEAIVAQVDSEGSEKRVELTSAFKNRGLVTAYTEMLPKIAENTLKKAKIKVSELATVDTDAMPVRLFGFQLTKELKELAPDLPLFSMNLNEPVEPVPDVSFKRTRIAIQKVRDAKSFLHWLKYQFFSQGNKSKSWQEAEALAAGTMTENALIATANAHELEQLVSAKPKEERAELIVAINDALHTRPDSEEGQADRIKIDDERIVKLVNEMQKHVSALSRTLLDLAGWQHGDGDPGQYLLNHGLLKTIEMNMVDSDSDQTTVYMTQTYEKYQSPKRWQAFWRVMSGVGLKQANPHIERVLKDTNMRDALIDYYANLKHEDPGEWQEPVFQEPEFQYPERKPGETDARYEARIKRARDAHPEKIAKAKEKFKAERKQLRKKYNAAKKIAGELVFKNFANMPRAEQEREIEDFRRYLMNHDTGVDFSGVQGGTAGFQRNAVNALKARKHIHPLIKEMYGPIENPFQNYLTSVETVSNLVAQMSMANFIKTEGVKEGWAIGPEEKKGEVRDNVFIGRGRRPNEYSNFVEIKDTETPIGRFLSGYKIDAALAKELNETYATHKDGYLLALYNELVRSVKMAKTVGGIPRSTIRNFEANFIFGLLNGIPVLKIAKETPGMFMSMWKTPPLVGGKVDPDLLRAVELNVTEDTHMAELAAMANKNHAFVANIVGSSDPGVFEPASGITDKVYDAWRGAVDYASRAYQTADTAHKFMQWKFKRDEYVRAKMWEMSQSDPAVKGLTAEQFKKQHPKQYAEAERLAAEEVRHTNPTYSLASRAVKTLSRRIPFGPFAIFMAEVHRTTVARMKIMNEQLRSENPVYNEMGRAKLMGHVKWAGLMFGLSTLSKALLGVDDDEDEANRKRLPPWMQNSMLLYAGGEKGKRYILDLSFNDPFAYYTSAFIGAMRDGPWAGMKELIEPALSEDLVFGLILDIRRNADENRRPIWDEGLSADEQRKQMLAYIYKRLRPGVLDLFHKQAEAIEGGYFDSKQEALGFVGFRPYPIDQQRTDLYKSQVYYRLYKQTNASILKELRRENFNPRRLREVYASATKQRKAIAAEWREYMRSSMHLGVVDPVEDVLGVIDKDRKSIENVFYGIDEPYLPSEDVMDTLLQKSRGLERMATIQALHDEALYGAAN